MRLGLPRYNGVAAAVASFTVEATAAAGGGGNPMDRGCCGCFGTGRRTGFVSGTFDVGEDHSVVCGEGCGAAVK